MLRMLWCFIFRYKERLQSVFLQFSERLTDIYLIYQQVTIICMQFLSSSKIWMPFRFGRRKLLDTLLTPSKQNGGRSYHLKYGGISGQTKRKFWICCENWMTATSLTWHLKHSALCCPSTRNYQQIWPRLWSKMIFWICKKSEKIGPSNCRRLSSPTESLAEMIH